MALRTSTTSSIPSPRSASLAESMSSNQQLPSSGSIVVSKSRSHTRSRLPSTVIVKGFDDANKPTPTTTTAKSSSPPCCSIPIAVLFVITCIFVALVFTVVTLVSSLAMTNEVVTSVESSLATSLQGAMKYVTDPLLKSQQYVMQLKEMIELRPETYACDDSIVQFPGNSSTVNFLFQIGMYGLHRKDLYNVFQTRVSKRFLKPDGSGPAGICCVISPGRSYLQLYLNNTQVLDRNINGSYLNTLSTQPGTSIKAVDVTTLALYRGAVQTTTTGWISDSIAPSVTGLAGPANKYSFFAHINNPSDPSEIWAVGIDHNMVDLKSTLLQATPPITVGQSTTPSQVSGAHTTMYDLNEGLVMASTHPDVPVASTYGLLYNSGASPSADVNNAYQAALDKCGATGCTDAIVTIGKSHVHTAYRIHIPDASLHLMMVSSVPRHFFFASADNAFAVSLGLSASCCIVIIAGCIALLVMIHRPLSSLKDNMMLAAELHNDKVEYTHSYLRDIAAVSAVFDGMNKQLLIARSFVPEAVLLGRTNDAFDEEEEGSFIDDKSASKSLVHMGSGANNKSKNLEDSTSSHLSIFSSSQLQVSSTVEKRIGVLSLNLVGFHTLCTPDRNTRPGKVLELSNALLTLAVKCAHEERGVMDSFHGDHFILTFNASRPVAGPLSAAVRAANAFIEEVQSRAQFADSPGVAAGAASGRAQVGTLGIDGYRRLSVVGDVYKNASALQLAAVQFLRMNRGITPVGCMVHESSIKELGSCTFHLQAVGCLQSAKHRSVTKESPPTIIGYFALPLGVGCAMTGNGADGEWLYEVGVIEASNPFHEPNRAMTALISGDVDECGRILDAMDFKNAGDESPRASVDGSEFNDESDITDIEVDESSAAHAWELVRHYHRHATATTEASAHQVVAALARQCTLPWVLFHQ